jgi:hypothetical protein
MRLICCSLLWAMLLITGCADARVVRFATFNASLHRESEGKLVADLSTPDDPQARKVAAIIQHIAPDVLLLNEFDHDEAGKALELFQRNYLAVSQEGMEPIHYRFRYTSPVNSGVASGVDLNGEGLVVTESGSRRYGEDALGFGLFPGQYGMVILSRYPIETTAVRTYRHLLWRDFPDASLPVTEAGESWYSGEALALLPLSSKSHWDVPIRINGTVVHMLASHSTPPAFDGPEDRNGRRNYDEIRFWARYIGDAAVRLPRPESGNFCSTLSGTWRQQTPAKFVIMGDLNADPQDGDSRPGAIQQLLGHPRVNASVVPSSDGAAEASGRQGGKNERHHNPPEHDTADFADTGRAPGNLRVDYVLPSKELKVVGGAVFWPTTDDPLRRLIDASDHRLVYLDLELLR